MRGLKANGHCAVRGNVQTENGATIPRTQRVIGAHHAALLQLQPKFEVDLRITRVGDLYALRQILLSFTRIDGVCVPMDLTCTSLGLPRSNSTSSLTARSRMPASFRSNRVVPREVNMATCPDGSGRPR